jgi:sugar phosphate isomerase/epimerase
MNLSMTTDYFRKSLCPEPYLRRIAEAGFTHLHWCHQWNTDFLYCEAEIAQIERWMRELGLGMTDLHASHGVEKAWGSLLEYERIAGVELVENRVRMTARLGGDVIIIHLPDDVYVNRGGSPQWDPVRRSLDELEPCCRREGVRIALENGDFDGIAAVFEFYGPDYVGLCYDSGHANGKPDAVSRLEAMGDRLISLHLHDNDGTGDQHNIPFRGTVDWPGVIRAVAGSAYRKWISLEVAMRDPAMPDEVEFLRESYRVAEILQRMLDEGRARAGA